MCGRDCESIAGSAACGAAVSDAGMYERVRKAARTAESPVAVLLLARALTALLDAFEQPVAHALATLLPLSIDARTLLLVRGLDDRACVALLDGKLCEQRGALERERVQPQVERAGHVWARRERVRRVAEELDRVRKYVLGGGGLSVQGR